MAAQKGWELAVIVKRAMISRYNLKFFLGDVFEGREGRNSINLLCHLSLNTIKTLHYEKSVAKNL